MVANGTPSANAQKTSANGSKAWTPMAEPSNQYAMGYAQGMASGAGVGEPPGRYQAQGKRQRQQARQARTRQTSNKTRTTNRTKTREYHIHINKAGGDGAGGGAAGEWSRQSPIGDAEFLSAGHVRAFAERGRRAMRQAAMDFSYAHEALRAVLREVPPPQGESRGQMWAKANRTARSLKRAANAAQAASAHSARTWPAFMREYAPQLNQMGGPRPTPRQRMNFGA